MNLEPVWVPERYQACFETIESHTCGEPTRVVVKGFPALQGQTMMERKRYASEHFDWMRSALMLEPRGHDNMFGAVLTEPVTPGAEFGVLFMDHGGFTDMCGHGTIGVATVLVEMGLVKADGPETRIKLDMPAGMIEVRVDTKGGRANAVTLRNVPSFLCLKDQAVVVDGQEIRYDVSYGGGFFALIDAQRYGYEIVPAGMPSLKKQAVRILRAINEAVSVCHPKHGVQVVDRCEFYCKLSDDPIRMRNVVISPEEMVDRSPCGTGTSAKLAAMHARGEIQVGVPMVNESFMGTQFTGIAVEQTRIGDFQAIVPEIIGKAHITGRATFVIDEDDPFGKGFSA